MDELLQRGINLRFSKVSIKTRLEFPGGLSKIREKKEKNFEIIFNQMVMISMKRVDFPLAFFRKISKKYQKCPSIPPVWLKNGIAQ